MKKETTAERLAVYLKLQKLDDLVLWCRRVQVPVTIDPASGYYEKYGQLGKSAMPDAPAVGLALRQRIGASAVKARAFARPRIAAERSGRRSCPEGTREKAEQPRVTVQVRAP